MTYIMRTVADLRPGDLVDLDGDVYADPDRNHPEFEFEFALVDTVERETDSCAVVYFEGFACGFPPQHRLKCSPVPTYYECGICGHMHPRSWNGDCRDDANRFTCEALDAKHGENNWQEVAMPTADGPQWSNPDDRYGERPTNPPKAG